MEESLDHDNYFGTRTISIAICGGSISRMTGLFILSDPKNPIQDQRLLGQLPA